jgi:hypothetical protein
MDQVIKDKDLTITAVNVIITFLLCKPMMKETIRLWQRRWFNTASTGACHTIKTFCNLIRFSKISKNVMSCVTHFVCKNLIRLQNVLIVWHAPVDAVLNHLLCHNRMLSFIMGLHKRKVMMTFTAVIVRSLSLITWSIKGENEISHASQIIFLILNILALN